MVLRLRAAGCVFAEDEARLLLGQARTAGELEALVGRRVAGEPLEVILGWADFAGLRITVQPGVFVPRRRSELLVAEAALLARAGSVVFDLCCGSGALAAALADRVPGVELYAADVDPAAVQCAGANLVGIGRVFAGDLYDALPQDLRGRVDVLVCNAPYVPTAAIGMMPSEARLHEPSVALDGGSDGLDVQRRVAAGVAAWLAPGGHVLVETGDEQSAESARLFTRVGLAARVLRSAESAGTVVIATGGGS